MTQAYLDWIATLDASGPTLRSVIELAPVTDVRDRERTADTLRGPPARDPRPY